MILLQLNLNNPPQKVGGGGGRGLYPTKPPLILINVLVYQALPARCNLVTFYFPIHAKEEVISWLLLYQLLR